jgi:predicted RNA-binding Zn ribbon-like protein
MESGRDIAELDLCGGDPAVDFVNTLGGALGGPWDDEWLSRYDDLVAWARRVDLLDGREAEAMRRCAAASPAAAAAVHAEAIALREALYGVLAALAHDEPAPPRGLERLRDAHAEAIAHARLVRCGDRIDWEWTGDLRRPLWSVVQAAVDLLRSDDRLARLEQCRNCRWLFLDASRNRSRRWCSMSHCGTAAKVRATRARRAAARTPPASA